MDNASWGALALALSVVAGIWTWYAFRHRGFAAGVRGVAVTMIPIAAYLTHTLRMFGRVGSAVSDWAAGFVFNPGVWVGLILGAVAVVLFAISYKLPSGTREQPTSAGRGDTKKPVSRSGRSVDTGLDDGLDDDIQAILRKHGIS